MKKRKRGRTPAAHPMSSLMFASLLAMSAPLPTTAQEVHTFRITSTDSATAIRDFGVQAGMQILASADDLKGKNFNPVNGTVAMEQALKEMLAGTGLTHRYVGARTIALVGGSTGPGFLLAAAAPAPAVQAQQADVGDAVDEVLVTARRREESLQEVPIAISALGGTDLEERGIRDIGSLSAVAPNLSVTGGAGGESSGQFRVRGMPGVAVYVDGVNQSTTDGLFTMSVVEVERIEVLRGPQGTLFGNASLGGAIHYVTRAPADTFGARVKATVGSFSRQDIHASIDLPLSDTFKTKFTVANEQRDGFVHSVTQNVSYGDINDTLYRADFLWEPTDDIRVRYNAEVSKTDREGPARLLTEVGTPSIVEIGGRNVSTYPFGQIYANVGIPFTPQSMASGYPGGELGEYDTRFAWPQRGLTIDTIRHSLDATWDINDVFRVRSISGYKELSLYQGHDVDSNALVHILDRDSNTRLFSFSQELQLLGSHDRVNWVLGAYYERQYNRTRANSRQLAEFNCDLWSDVDIANRGVSIADQASCFNLRARAVGVDSIIATPQMTRTQIQGLQPQLAAINAANGGPELNGVNLSNFSGSVPTNADPMSISRPETQAVFGDLTWRLTDRFTAGLGLRYSKDTREALNGIGVGNLRSQLVNHEGQFLGGNIMDPLAYRNIPPLVKQPEYSALTRRITLQYQWTPDLMTYVGYADGYQPGGTSALQNTIGGLISIGPDGRANGGYLRDVYNAGSSDVPLTVTRPEQTVDSFEVGLRADWFGGALRTNVTAFYVDWRNVPIGQAIATMWWDTDHDGFADSQIDITGDGVNDPLVYPTRLTVSADKSEVSGLELEATYRMNDLRLGLNLGYLKTEYKEVGLAGMGVVPAIDKGSSFVGAPEYTANFTAQYNFHLGSGAAIIPLLNYTYTDDYMLWPAASKDEERLQKGFGQLNARVTYNPDANWSVSLTGSNLTDEWYANSGIYGVAEQLHFVTIGRPREWGLEFAFTFE